MGKAGPSPDQTAGKQPQTTTGLSKEPVVLKTARVKPDGLWAYTFNQQVLEDISLGYSNYGLYNRPDSEELKCAERLEDCPREEQGGTDYDVDKEAPGKASTTFKVHLSLAGVEGDTKTVWKTPVTKSMVLETHLAAVSVTQTTRANAATTKAPEETNIATTTTAVDAITPAEDTVTANVPEDVASHDDNVLHTRCLQPVHQNESYFTQDCNVAEIYTGPLPRAERGGSGVSKLMVNNTQEARPSTSWDYDPGS